MARSITGNEGFQQNGSNTEKNYHQNMEVIAAQSQGNQHQLICISAQVSIHDNMVSTIKSTITSNKWIMALLVTCIFGVLYAITGVTYLLFTNYIRCGTSCCALSLIIFVFHHVLGSFILILILFHHWWHTFVHFGDLIFSKLQLFTFP